MKQLYIFFLLITFCSFSQNVTITKVIETGCADPFVKTVELYVDGTVNFANFGTDGIQNTADDEVILNYMQNGGTWSAIQIDISALGTVSDSFVYIVRDIPLMEAEFPSSTFDASNTVVVTTATNGDDGYQVVLNGVVVSQFGETDTDGTGTVWEHVDAVATRKDGIPDIGVWDPTHWDFTALNSTDTETSCETGGTTNLENYFNSLGLTFPLGSGSGWTPTGATCTTALGSTSVSCDSITSGTSDDTYTATIDFVGGNNGYVFQVLTSNGVVTGDNPSSVESGTIVITGITEGTDITVTVDDTADGGVCSLSADIASPACLPIIINEVLFDPATDITGDANGDGVRDALDDEFIEFYNESNTPLDISGFTVSDASALRHTFPASTIIPAQSFLVLFGGGTPTGSFGGSIVQIASEGQLNLNNAGDIITVENSNGDIVLVYDSSATGINHGQDQSVTRNPDFTGNFVLHTDANASLLFSPGLKNDGTTLSTSDILKSDRFRIYPNPVTNKMIHIESAFEGLKQFTLSDINGRTVLNKTTDSNVLNVSDVTPGFYLLYIQVSNQVYISKLIIK